LVGLSGAFQRLPNLWLHANGYAAGLGHNDNVSHLATDGYIIRCILTMRQLIPLRVIMNSYHALVDTPQAARHRQSGGLLTRRSRVLPPILHDPPHACRLPGA